MDEELLPRYYCFLTCTVIWGLGFVIYHRNRRFCISVNYLTLAFLLFVGYIIVRNLFSPINIEIWYTVGILVFYFLCLKTPQDSVKHIDLAIVCICILQAAYGLGEFVGIFPVYSAFPILGSFDNPVGFACCVAMGYPICLYYIYENGRIKWLGVVGALILCSSIILSESRTAILMLLASTVLFYIVKYRNQLTKYKKVLIPTVVSVLIAIFIILFYYKPASALGRLAIWRITAGMIPENPVFGAGNEAFIAHYMPSQALYFTMYPDSLFSQLADNIYHPFNEYLLLAYEYGLTGLLLLVSVIFIALKYGKKESSHYLIFISAGIGAFFSYVFSYPFIWVVVIYALANMSKSTHIVKELSIRRPVYIITLCFILISGCIYSLCKDAKFEYQWKKIASESLAGQTLKMLPEYEKLYVKWNGNPFFLYNYGAELNHIEDYIQSQAIFAVCQKYLDSYDIQMMQADNFSNIHAWNDAESSYLQAANMCPNRFLPLTGLLDVYIQTQNDVSAHNVANDILSKEIKIHSNITIDAINKAKAYLY